MTPLGIIVLFALGTTCSLAEPTKICCGGICLPDFLVHSSGSNGKRNDPQCGENEEADCCGTSCPKKCFEPAAEDCAAVCVEGCFCQEGFCLDENGACVKDTDVNGFTATLCEKNEVYDDCGTACPNQCGEPPAEACIAVCVEGCRCRDEYCSNANGTCLPEKEDDVSIEVVGDNRFCVINAEYDECGSYCPKRCGEDLPEVCPEMCVEGCRCRQGYCLEEDGTCSLDFDGDFSATVVSRMFSYLCPFDSV